AADHHQRAADAGLQVLVGKSAWLRAEIILRDRRRFVGGVDRVDGDDAEFDAQGLGELLRVRNAVLAAVTAGERQPVNLFGTDRRGRDVTGQRTVDAARE